MLLVLKASVNTGIKQEAKLSQTDHTMLRVMTIWLRSKSTNKSKLIGCLGMYTTSNDSIAI